MGCGEFIVKYILFFANLFFALAGLALLGIGVAVQLKASQVTDLIDGGYELGSIGTMVVGGVVFFIAFFGCCGAIKESNCMLVTYSIFMIVLMLAKIVLATLIFVNREVLLKEVNNMINQTFSNDLNLFHELESSLSCCGTTGPASYGITIISLPSSCCASDTCTVINAFPGCIEVLDGLVNSFSLAIGVVCIVVVSVELVAVVFGLCLANHVRNRSRRSRY